MDVLQILSPGGTPGENRSLRSWLARYWIKNCNIKRTTLYLLIRLAFISTKKGVKKGILEDGAKTLLNEDIYDPRGPHSS